VGVRPQASLIRTCFSTPSVLRRLGTVRLHRNM